MVQPVDKMYVWYGNARIAARSDDGGENSGREKWRKKIYRIHEMNKWKICIVIMKTVPSWWVNGAKAPSRYPFATMKARRTPAERRIKIEFNYRIFCLRCRCFLLHASLEQARDSPFIRSFARKNKSKKLYRSLRKVALRVCVAPRKKQNWLASAKKRHNHKQEANLT